MNWNSLIKPVATFAVLVLSSAAIPAFAAGANNYEAAKKLAETCQSCHGADGNSTAPIYPRIAGQYADYLARALHEYKNGERVNPIMAIYVEKLSDQDISDLAAYYAAMPGKLDDLQDHMQAK